MTPPRNDSSAARHNRANSGSDRSPDSSPSIQNSIAPNTAAAIHRAATVSRS